MAEANPKRIERPYPRRTLEQALRVAEALKEHNAGNEWTPDQVAAALQLGSRSGNFFYLTAASRDFGLTDGTRETKVISLTPLGRRVVYPSSAQERDDALLEAFLSVPLFKGVVEYYGGNNLPEKQFLSNVLKTQFNLDEPAHDEFVEFFDKNCRFLGIGSSFNGTPSRRSGPVDGGEATVTVGKPKKNTGDAPVCFIIMPFSERDDRHAPGFFSEVLESILEEAVTNAGFIAKTARRQGSDVIQATIVNDLIEADIVLADLTEHNPNVLFELGMRMAIDKPVALIRAKGTGPIFDVDNMLRVQEYDPNLWVSTVKKDVPTIQKHLEAAWESRDSDVTFLKILKQQSRISS
jgi:nucleoside 2-deoxyribosyltransferase